MRLDIRYRTSFTYDALVRESQNELRACPITDEHQQLVSYRVTTFPSAKVSSFVDYWGTRVDAFGLRSPHVAMEVVAEATVETLPRPLFSSASHRAALDAPAFRDEHAEYLAPSPHAEWDEGVRQAATTQAALVGPDTVGMVLAMHRFVGTSLRYTPGSTEIGVSVEDVLAHGHGVCQDFAHLAVALCRSQGIPARYVSGYLFTRDETTNLDPSEDGDDDVVSVQTHAWFEAAVPGVGWLGLDPTNQQPVGPRHVKIGHGRDYDDVQPLRGIFSGNTRATVEPHVEIRRLPAAAGRPTSALQQQ
ncbi:transglutaminase family protein [Rhabdothermincola salaria]|uniref:transglutaminase family protein n=1 Tax=Rhabdothermincola salaria TaxID=2903142 RepID=UPI001E45D2DD|nr:transglutaminase family protein [Rhabdothermincola salaria]MCD9623407.1 transglutaminase family protein [Rhabdothermincola salaria]